MISLTIVRHGETVENQLGFCQGHQQGHLSPIGIHENQKLALRLKDHHFDMILSSPLKRAVDTGLEIQKIHKNTPLVTDIRLIERDMGVLQGQKFPPDYDYWSASFEGMEEMSEIDKRLSSLLNELRDSYRDQSILLISHGITISVLLAKLKDIPLRELSRVPMLENSTYEAYCL